MISTLFGKKMKSTQQFSENGIRMPVTYVEVLPHTITLVEPTGRGTRIEMAFGIAKKLTKAIEGHSKKAGMTEKPRFFRSIIEKEIGETEKVGAVVKLGDVFSSGDMIRVTGISKGKGFAGVVKRHHFKGGPKTHGQSDRERSPGSIGSTTTPGRVFKGKRMAGRLGGERVVVRHLRIVSVDEKTNVMGIKGVIPGSIANIVEIEKEG